MGKHKPIWDPSTDCGDYVVATGCSDLHTTGKKRLQKQYYTHTTRPGSLKQMSMDQMIEKWGGGEVLKRAVRGMLPKNRLRDKRMARLKGTLLAGLDQDSICSNGTSTLTVYDSVRGPRTSLQAKYYTFRRHVGD